VPEDYIAEGCVALSQNQIHYLRNVMRLETGVLISLFNGKDGEWLGALEGLSKKKRISDLERKNQKNRLMSLIFHWFCAT